MQQANFSHARVLKLIRDPFDYVKYYKSLQNENHEPYHTLFKHDRGYDLSWRGLKAVFVIGTKYAK